VKSLFVAFDVDGTLTCSNTSFAFGRFLYEKGRISSCQALRAALRYAAHRLGFLSVQALHTGIFGILFLGKDKNQIDKDVVRFLDAKWEGLVRKSMLKELSSLEGQRIALLSSSPDFLIREIARRLGLKEWYATEYVTDSEGRFQRLGRIVTGAVKAQIVQEVKKNDGLAIMALTDSMQDAPLLEEAATVVAVFPERRLARLAKERGWRIVEG
jgi:HAD superfamily phosphoserine phosphatase-like hydrolase